MAKQMAKLAIAIMSFGLPLAGVAQPPAACSAAAARQRVAIVTGASSNHFRSLLGLLASLEALRTEQELEAKVLVFDLGLSTAETDELSLTFPSADQRKLHWPVYPPHVSDLQTFAWKPIIIQKVVEEERCGSRRVQSRARESDEMSLVRQDEPCETVFWLDAGCIVSDTERFVTFLASCPDPAWHEAGVKAEASGEGGMKGVGDEHGALLTRSNGKVGMLTHEVMMRQLAGYDYGDAWQANGGVVGFCTGSRAVEEVLRPWVACALDAGCISPPGSTRRNHRQDQSALSILAHSHGYPLAQLPSVGIEVHRDVDIELVITHGERGYHASTPVFTFTCQVRCLAGEAEEQCCSKGLAMAYLNDQLPVQFGGTSSDHGLGAVDTQEDISFFCKSTKALEVHMDLTPDTAAAPVLRLELVLIDPLSGQIVTSHVREFSNEE